MLITLVLCSMVQLASSDVVDGYRPPFKIKPEAPLSIHLLALFFNTVLFFGLVLVYYWPSSPIVPPLAIPLVDINERTRLSPMDPMSSFDEGYPLHLEDHFFLLAQLLLDIIMFLPIFICIISPPDLLVRWGLTLENLHPTFIRDGSLLTYLDIKISFNRLILAFLLNVYVIYTNVAYGPFLVLQISLAVTFGIFMYCLEQFENCWSNYSRGERSSLPGFSTDELRSIDSLPYTTCPFFVAQGSYSNAILLNDKFFINERRFGYSIERIADLNFCIYGRTADTFDQRLTIIAERNDHSNKYEFSISSRDLRGLEKYTLVDVMRHVFRELFKDLISKNPRHRMSGINNLDLCFACDTNRPAVIIRKNCADYSYCTYCQCRPAWCVACFALIISAPRLKKYAVSTWLEFEERCPFCRETFCFEDVLLIEEATDGEVVE